MINTSPITFEDNQQWQASSRGIYTDEKGPCIVIPISQIQNLTHEEIGKRVIEAVEVAREFHAVRLIHDLLNNGLSQVFSRKQGPLEDTLRLCVHVTQSVSPYLGELDFADTVCDAAWSFLEETRREQEKPPESYPLRPITRRSEFNRKRNDLFIQVGQRDGFKCAACLSPDHLAVDHIVALSTGGSDDPENLQLLCKPCNSKKGTQTIDYRPQIKEEV